MRTILCEAVVGREEELDTARTSLVQAELGTGSLLSVLGEAGVGKSRLAREVVSLARGRGFCVLFGRAVQADTPVPFRPFAEALLSHFRDDGPPEAAELGPFRPVLGRLLPEWRIHDSAANEPVVVLAEALVRLLRFVAGSTGCLLVLEDMHWSDPESIAVLQYFADALRSEPIVCLMTVRSEEQSAARALSHGLRASRTATVLELAKLKDAEVERMAADCLRVPAAPPEAVRFLSAWCDGLPFLVEELLTGAAVAGALVTDGDGWSFDAAATPTVPVTFGEGVQRRLAELGPDGQRVLRFAATLGRRFDWALLPIATGLGEDVVLEALREAVDAQLLVAEPGSHFRFRHALTRDAVLGQLLPAERAAVSRRLVEAIEIAHPGLPGEWCELAAELAERSGQQERAATLLLETARRSLAVGALGSAELTLERARRSVEDARLLSDLDEVRLEVLSLAGKAEEAMAVGDAIVDVLDRLGVPPRRSATVHLAVARAAVTACVWDTAERHLASARRLAGAAADDELAARVDTLAANAALGRGEPDVARSLAERGLEAAERLGTYELACEALEVIGRCHRLGDLDAAARVFERGRRLAEQHHLDLWRLRALVELNAIDQMRGVYTERITAARDLALACGAWAVVAHTDLQLALSWLDRVDPEKAVASSRRCAQTARRLGMDVLVANALVAEMTSAAERADRPAVEALYDEALAIAPLDTGVRGLGGMGLAFLALMEEDHPLALRHLEQTAEVLRGVPTAPPVPLSGFRVLLLTVDAARADEAFAARTEVAASAASQHFWVQAYLHYADAVERGREGMRMEAEAAVAAGDAVLGAATVARPIARRLVAPCAIADGWGEPSRWLLEALAFFEAKELARVADACRALLRSIGTPVPRRGRATEGTAGALRAAGVTGREAEILGFLAQGLANREIAERAYLSPRTVERHLANIAAKVGTRTRSELIAFAARNLAG